MQVIRKQMFETNSSSCHSIIISDKDVLDDIMRPDPDGRIIIYSGEFGWGPEAYYDAYTKASYIYTDNLENTNVLDMLERAIKEVTGATEVLFVDNGGYIDHQSCGTSSNAVVSPETLKRFIFSRQSTLIIDNDNH